MPQRQLKTLAVLGLTSGLLVSQQVAAEIVNDGTYPGIHSGHSCSSCKNNKSCSSCKTNKTACKGKGGCGGLTADADQPKTPYANPSPKPSTDSSKSEDQKKNDPNDGNLKYKMMTEQELLLELNEEGIQKYKSLTPEGKALALKVASGACGSTNDCRGLNACKTEHNDCAGKGECAGKGICAFSDKNLAVKVVYDKMQAKRQNLTK